MVFIKYVQAEFIKLKYLPVLWLSGVVVTAILVIIFTGHMLDLNSISLNVDPWRRTLVACQGIFSIFMSIPFVVLFISAALYIEHQSNAWKYQYTIPTSRILVVLSKLSTIIIWIIGTIFLLTLGLILVGYILDYFLPEYEFAYYDIPYLIFVEKLSHNFLALLGIIGIQYFLCFQFKGFLIPASIGIVAFICGLILASTNNSLALSFPYSYPMIVTEMDMFKLDKVGIVKYGWFNNVELFSSLFFFIFVALTCLMEQRRNVI